MLVQPTYMTPGEEFEKKVLETVPKYASRYEKLLVGELTGFDGDAIELDGETKIPLADIAQVRLHIDF